MRKQSIALLCALCTLALAVPDEGPVDVIDDALADLHPQQDTATPLHVPLKPFESGGGRHQIRSRRGARPTTTPHTAAANTHPQPSTADDFDPFVSDAVQDSENDGGSNVEQVESDIAQEMVPKRSWTQGRRTRPSTKQQRGTSKQQLQQLQEQQKQQKLQQQRPSFQTIGTALNAQRVTSHDFAPLYERYLATRRDQPLRLLEIGVGQGCEAPGLPVGVSVALWEQYLPKAAVSFLEVNEQCAKQLRGLPNGGTLYIGDQADAGILKQVASDAASFGGWDVIIDDGGHTMEQQVASLRGLWHAVKPGGVYVVEAAITSYLPAYGGGKPGKPGTFMTLVQQALHALQCVNKDVRARLRATCKHHATLRDVQSVDVFPEAVVFVKRTDDDNTSSP